MINKKLINFKTREEFLKSKDQIYDWSIVFIDDTREIWTHQTGFQSLPGNGEVNQILGMTEEGPAWVNRWRILEEKSPYEFIDLGLSVDWCTCNIGATKPEEYGWYFQWGDTKAYNSDRTPVGGGGIAISFDWENYPLCNGTESTMTKYCINSSYGTVDNKTVLEPEDDAAHVHIGGDCRMPTGEELNELLNACNTEWVTNYNDSGIKGRLFTLKSDPTKTLFFPAGGNLDGMSWEDAGQFGYCWSSSISSSSSSNGQYLNFFSNNCRVLNSNRYYGWATRAVLPKS